MPTETEPQGGVIAHETDPDAARAVLKTDFTTGILAIGAGLISDGIAAVQQLPLVAVGFLVLMAGGLGVAEHGSIPGVFPEVTALAALVAIAGAAVVAIQYLPAPTGVVASAIVIGAGVGIVAYRALYGLVLPVPAGRIS